MYLVTLLRHGVIIIVSVYDSHWHTPVYLFLSNLLFLDISYTSSSRPLFLSSFLTSKKTIFFSGCEVQMFLSFAMGTTECDLLSTMVFDHYVVICNPLRFPSIMSKVLYMPMAAGCWIAAGVNFVLETSLVMQLPFCGYYVVNHYTCEILAVLVLACIVSP